MQANNHMPTDNIDIFVEWLDTQESLKGWTDYRLAKEANISFSVLSRARNDGVLPKWDACVAIAGALKVSPITVFRAAGLLPPGPDDQVQFNDWQYLLAQLTPEEQEEMREIAEGKIRRREKEKSLKSLDPRKSRGKI